MNIVTIYSTLISKGRRIAKFLSFGKDDVRTSYEVAPFGTDANPIKGMRAIYSETGINGETVIIGYINEKQAAAPGEVRHYSLDENGNVKFYTHHKADGTFEIGGNSHNAVRYIPLNSGLQALVTKINIELTKIQDGLSGVGGVYTKLDVSLDIDASKINEVKTL